jgi:diazepam-binding inhibitor (GABA receptor modulating acyl-CoA-binding protein)
MELQEAFAKAVDDSKTLPAKPTNDILLKLYSLYKQAEQGDAGDEAPSNPFDIIGRAKYDAWVTQKGKSKEAAMQEYVTLIDDLKSK